MVSFHFLFFHSKYLLTIYENFEPSTAHSSMHSVKSASCNIKEALKDVTADQRKRKSSLGHSVIVLYLSGLEALSFSINITLLYPLIAQE